ncbi:MAG TPA: hypothetical protein VFE59_34905 [Trebonia sp.]|jgi:hypothetical protein|nr:hypothetical protein [Trebonia sp.]
MSARPIIDAGPGLNFLSVNKERLLISVLGPLSAPETVQDEVFRKSAQDSRFRAAATVWRKLSPRWIQILSDDATPELAAVVQRISGSPMDERKRQSKDLGETMVIAHAVVAAESGQSVTVLMDDGPGARITTLEINRLERLRSSGRPVGSIILASTLTVLGRGAGTGQLPDRAAMRDTYKRLRGLDDGLPPIEKTGLLSHELWS